MTPVSEGIKEGPAMAFTIRGLMHARRTVELCYPLSGCLSTEPDCQ